MKKIKKKVKGFKPDSIEFTQSMMCSAITRRMSNGLRELADSMDELGDMMDRLRRGERKKGDRF